MKVKQLELVLVKVGYAEKNRLAPGVFFVWVCRRHFND